MIQKILWISLEKLFSGNVRDFSKKHLYDTWLISLIFNVFNLNCSIGLAIFGLLIFMNLDSFNYAKYKSSIKSKKLFF